MGMSTTITHMTVLTISWFRPHMHPKECWSEDNWQMGQTAISITSLMIWLEKDKMLHPVKYSTPYSVSTLHLQLLSPCWWRRPISVNINTQISLTKDLFYHLMSLNLKCLFLAIITQMKYNTRGNLKDYLFTTEQFFSPFYEKTMRCNTLLHTLRFLQFSNSENDPDNNDGKPRHIQTCWMMHTQYFMPILNIWLHTKL
jgi:hypothetical protein